MKKRLQIRRHKQILATKRWSVNNPEKVKQSEKDRRAKRRDNPVTAEEDRQYRRGWWKENGKSQKEYRRDYKLQNRYGISAAEYDEMLMEQGGVCAICKGESGNTRLVVDHNHETEQVRAILCHSCNVGLGMLEDDPARLKKAIRYLKRFKI